MAKHFQVAPKKLYEALMGKCYDPGHKLPKAEKLTKGAEKVTSTTPPMADKNMKATDMYVDDEGRTQEKDEDEPALPKKLLHKNSGKKSK